MKFDKQQKITLGILFFLIIGAIISVTPTIIETFKELNKTPKYIAVNMDLEEKFPEIANKYNAFPDIFKQKEPVLVYGYIPGDLNNTQSEVFDKKLNELIKNENIQHKILSYKNWKPTVKTLLDKHIDNDATCTMVTEEQEYLESYLGFINRCFTEACIIDVKKKNYVQIDRDAEFIIKIIKKEVTPQD